VDAVVRALDLKPGQDVLQKLLDRLEDDPPECVKMYWEEVSRFTMLPAASLTNRSPTSRHQPSRPH
jgi:hypothetical protein